MNAPSRAYVLCPVSRPQATHRLVCVPWSGAGPGVYNRWARELPDEVELLTVVLPRSTAWRDQEFSVESIAEQVAYDLLTRHGEVERLALFGHSLGALVAFDLAVRLQAQHIALDGVIVSGSRAAHLDPPVPLHRLEDAGLADALIELGGLAMDLRYDTRFLERILPRVRADLAACERYRPATPTRLAQGCRLFAWAANGDWYAPPDSVAPWTELADPGHASVRTWAGDHFFVRDFPVDTPLAALGWPHGTVHPDPTALERAA
ncbi:thioesterase II family protein [Lentzea terrae]|uniref:thioesterase II family protein n=1 Tax=Lentzea terrae TaxID=2200761 RepID=UPI000DD3287B|nr:thioesterase domain-containing protein [Lentzea terrae]